MKLILLIFGLVLLIGTASATYYYVTPGAGGGGDGSEGSPWTITEGFTNAVVGNTILIQGGNYGHVHPVVANSGTSGNYIIFKGDNGTPIIDGTDGFGYGIEINGKDYIKIQNLVAYQYEQGFHIVGNNIILDNINATNNYYYGIHLEDSEYIVLNNSVAIDNGMNGISTKKTNYTQIYNISVTATTTPIIRESGANQGMDYYLIVGYGHDNTVYDIVANNTRCDNSTFHPGHGVGIKDDPSGGVYIAPHSYNNIFYNITVIGTQEPFLFSHGSYDNTLHNFSIDSSGLVGKYFYGLTIRDGTHNNTLYDGTVIGNEGSECTLQFDENEAPGEPTSDNNTIRNIMFRGATKGILLSKAINNIIENCVFVGKNSGSPVLFSSGTEYDNIFKNNIVTNFTTLGSSNVSITYSDFWGNGFATPGGTGNIGTNPLYVDLANNDFHLNSQYGRWDGSGWVYDSVTSPCIDTGNPSDDYNAEPEGNGNRINIGVYGNTSYASKSGNTNIEFISSTLANDSTTSENYVEVNTSINSTYLNSYIWNWNGTNTIFLNGSCVLYMSFDNNSAIGESSTVVVDVSQYENNGSFINDSTGSWTTDGKWNGAMLFDGVDDNISISENNFPDGSNTRTFMMWFKTIDSIDIYRTLFSYGSLSLTNAVYISMPDDGDSNMVVDDSIGITQHGDGISTTVAVNDGLWHHLVVTFNGTTWFIYLDGVLNNSKTMTTNTIKSGDANIGSTIGGGSSYFPGTIDEVRVYDRVLSSEEINQSYMSNLYKYNHTQWYFYTNQTDLSNGEYNYQIFANHNESEYRVITVGTTGTSTIIIPANSLGMFNNWTTATTFSNIVTNESNDVCYTYYNVTTGEWESHYPPYSWNFDYVIPLEASVMMFVDAQTTVTSIIVTPVNTSLYTGWNMLFIEGVNNETIADIKADIGANCTAVWAYNSTAGAYTNSSTYSVQPCQGVLVYLTQNMTWIRSDL